MSAVSVIEGVETPLDEQKLEELPEAANLLDDRCKVSGWNRRAEKLIGFHKKRVMGNRCIDCIDENGVPLCLTRCPAVATIHDGQPRETRVYRRHNDGRLLPLKLQVYPTRDEENKITGAVEILKLDSAEAQKFWKLKAIRELSLLDKLTGLPNRKAMRLCLRTWLGELDKIPGGMGVIIGGIDKFKYYEENFGLGWSEQILADIAFTLKNNYRAYDVVSRWGMEKFIVLVHLPNPDDLQTVAERTRLMIQQAAFEDNQGERLKMTISVGATMAKSEDSHQTLVYRADGFLNRSQKEGGNTVTLG